MSVFGTMRTIRRIASDNDLLSSQRTDHDSAVKCQATSEFASVCRHVGKPSPLV